MSDYLDPNNEELLKDFFVEAELQLETLEQNILVLEQNTSDSDAIDEIFRAAHTLKGASATVQMDELSGFTHIVEDVFDEIRSGNASVNEDMIDVLLSALDIIKAMMEERSNGSVFSEDISETTNRLEALKEGSEPVSRTSAKVIDDHPSAETKDAGTDIPSLSEYDLLELKEAAEESQEIYQVIVKFNEDNPMNTVGGIQVFAALKTIGTILKTYPEFEALYEDNFYPIVVYYIATSESQEVVEKNSGIPDVTLEAFVMNINKMTSSDSGIQKQVAEEPPQTIETEPIRTTEAVESNEPEKVTETIVSEPDEKTEDAKKNEELLASKREAENKAKTELVKKNAVASSSILRVESKRIDDLLNLVSETVINKATFTQVSSDFNEDLVVFQQLQSEYKQQLKELFDAIPQYLEKAISDNSVKDIKREIMENFGNLSSNFDGLNGRLKNSVSKFRSTAQSLGRITGELQEGVMRIRMVPISQIFSRFPRLIRDLSKSLAKKVNLQIEGEDTELDKSVIEDLLDPLIHCVRNSLDHGIEDPNFRKKAGKAEEGSLVLRASNEGNMILIEIFDDGKGIDVEAVKKRAIDRGIIHPSKVLSDVEAFNLIFEPGFSTAASVTNISGRGVGLDVVKKQIEKLNGNVSVWSEAGKGTRFTIKIPLTLAIIQGLLVRVGSEIYVIPITAVLESHRITPKEIRTLDNYEVFNVREDVISLMRLNRIFNIEMDEQKEHLFVVIIGSGDKKMGLIVDALIGEEDVVIKPLKDHYTNAPGIAGANITGDGTVSLIIDVSQLLDLGQKSEAAKREKQAV